MLAPFTAERGKMKFRVELVWKDSDDDAASSIFLTADGRVVVQGRKLTEQERKDLSLPLDAEMISIDRKLINAIKEML
jgi:hypothetical protein